MSETGIRSVRNIQRQPNGTYVVDVELDCGIVIQGVSVRGAVAEAPVHVIERTVSVSHQTYRSAHRKCVPEPTFIFVSAAAKERIGAAVALLTSREVGETSTPRLFEDVGGEK